MIEKLNNQKCCKDQKRKIKNGKKPRRFKADGYCPDSNTVFQFDGESHFFINQLYAITSTELTFFYHLGCFYHGCKCLIGKTKLPDEMTAAQRKKIAAKRKKIAAKKRNKDKIRNAYTRRQSYNLVVKKECEWKKVKKLLFQIC